MPEPSAATISDSFGLDDHASALPDGQLSPTNESIKDRQAMRRLVNAGVLAPDQMPTRPRILIPILSADEAPEELRAAARAALSMPSQADED